MTRTSREVIQVFFVKLIWLRACLLTVSVVVCPMLEAWAMCYFINNLLTSSAHAATLHYKFPACARRSRKQCFLCRRRVWWGGRAGTGGGRKTTPACCFRCFARFWYDQQEAEHSCYLSAGAGMLCRCFVLNSTFCTSHYHGFLSGIIRQNWNDTEKISMAPAQG